MIIMIGVGVEEGAENVRDNVRNRRKLFSLFFSSCRRNISKDAFSCFRSRLVVVDVDEVFFLVLDVVVSSRRRTN